MNWTPIVILLLVVGLPVFIIIMLRRAVAKREEERRQRIYRKYGHTEVAKRIIEKTIWVGETEAQLSDSLGAPVDTDEKVLKTKTKVIWKYHHQGGNRYGLRITVENGLIVGWDEKL